MHSLPRNPCNGDLEACCGRSHPTAHLSSCVRLGCRHLLLWSAWRVSLLCWPGLPHVREMSGRSPLFALAWHLQPMMQLTICF